MEVNENVLLHGFNSMSHQVMEIAELRKTIAGLLANANATADHIETQNTTIKEQRAKLDADKEYIGDMADLKENLAERKAAVAAQEICTGKLLTKIKELEEKAEFYHKAAHELEEKIEENIPVPERLPKLEDMPIMKQGHVKTVLMAGGAIVEAKG